MKYLKITFLLFILYFTMVLAAAAAPCHTTYNTAVNQAAVQSNVSIAKCSTPRCESEVTSNYYDHLDALAEELCECDSTWC